jgi:hypothetical protein
MEEEEEMFILNDLPRNENESFNSKELHMISASREGHCPEASRIFEENSLWKIERIHQHNNYTSSSIPLCEYQYLKKNSYQSLRNICLFVDLAG